MRARLLSADSDFDGAASPPSGQEDLVTDLELATLLHAMAAGDTFLYRVAEKVLLSSLTDPAAIRYRQRVLADCLAQPQVIRAMYAVAAGALEDKRDLWSMYGGSQQSPSGNLSGAVAHLEAYAARLRQLREIADAHAGAFTSDGMTTLLATLRLELDDEYLAEVGARLRELRFRSGVLISAELDRDTSGINLVLRAPDAVRRPLRERLRIEPRSSYSFTVDSRDDAGAQILDDLTSRGVNLVANAAAQSADHLHGFFMMLRTELGFYVGCLNLAGRLAAKGVPVAVPEPAKPSSLAFSCTDLRDVCLELASPAPVTGNDVTADGKPLMIITGASSGGKSTFLRSVGLAQLMMQCGLFVTAGSYASDAAAGIFSHFTRGEDPGMTSGRLDDELKRMRNIADRIGPHCLVLFNESFAGTNEREGAEIGYQIVRALLEAQVRVCYVTHRYELADRFRRLHADTTLFLRAERDARQQAGGRRNYKLAAKEPLPTSFGEDLYYRLGGWLEEDGSHASEI